MKKQKPVTKQDELINKHWVNPFQTMPKDWFKAMRKMMDEYAETTLQWVADQGYDFSIAPKGGNYGEELLEEFKKDKL